MSALLADPEVTSIPVDDAGEALVDLRALGFGYLGTQPAGAWVRAGVADRLLRAAAELPRYRRLLVREAHRSPAEQHRILTAYRAALLRRTPDLDELTLRRMASRFVAPLDVAPHVAGAAVDLTLGDASGRVLAMGRAGAGDDAERSARICAFASEDIDAEARANRDLLGGALSAAGLVNYPSEWWHWSFGDRYWAYATSAGTAIYGPVDALTAAA